jgi:hypothetical protein
LEKFFKFIDRVNALAFFTGVVLATGLLLWAVGSWLWEGKAKTSVVVPNASAEKSEVLSLTAWEFIPETGVQVLRLQSTGGEANEYASEGRGYKTRNLLFVKSDGGESSWLFPDQSHLLSRVERLTTPDGRTKAIYFESRLANEKGGPEFSLYLAKPDGASPVEVLKKVDQVVTSRVVGKFLNLIYKKELRIRKMVINMDKYEVISDEILVEMKKIESE